MQRTALIVPVVLAALLRAIPLDDPHLGLELQEKYARVAVVAIARHDWDPSIYLVHGSGMLDALRALFTAWYGAGRLVGAYHDRLDLVGAFLRDPLPFVIAGRVLVLLAAVLTVHLVARLGASLACTAAGAAGALLLAVSFIHVRESTHVWPDVPAAAAVLAAVALALAARQRAGLVPAVVAGGMGGLALAIKHSAFPVLLPVLLGALDGPGRGRRARLLRAGTAALAAVVVYAVLSPHVLLAPGLTLSLLRAQSNFIFTKPPDDRALSLPALIDLCLGWPTCVLAGIGALFLLRRDPRATLIVALFPLVQLAVVLRGYLLFARYLLLLAPFVALFAGAGTVAVARLLSPRRTGLALVPLLAAVAFAPGRESLAFVRLLTREDTRLLAGAWIEAHVPGGTPLTLPNLVAFPNPVLPPAENALRLRYPPPWVDAFRRQGLGDPARTYPAYYFGAFDTLLRNWTPGTAVVVTASHPVVLNGMNPSPEARTTLAASGARVLARFEGVPEPLPAGIVYDPYEADYAPLRGAAAVPRPGPTITIWELPR
jgi:hypothetical protein